MDTAIVALIISSVSAFIAVLSLGWNIYRDIIQKPRLVANFSIVSVLSDRHNSKEKHSYMRLEATNFGPGLLTVHMPCIRKVSFLRRILRNTKLAAVIPSYETSRDKLPKTLNVSESIVLLFPYDNQCFLKEDYTHIGITDSFGRINWSPKRQVKKARQRWSKDFRRNPREVDST